MSLPLRPFVEVLEVFRASESKKKLKRFPDLHYAAEEAHSFGNLARVELRQEHADDGDEGPGDEVSLLLADWTLSDGWAAAVLHAGDTELATRLLGLTAWPEQGWKREGVWYGE